MTATLTDVPQGDTRLLEDPVAQRLLTSTEMAHLAYRWTDGAPRCTAIWFHWNGTALVIASPAAAPKAKALTSGTPVAVTIDDTTFPYASLNLRGTVQVDRTYGVAEEYRLAARRYLGAEQGDSWSDQMPPGGMIRISLTPTWVGLIVIDEFRRLPSALAS
jgi:hypothetical protein